MAGLGWLVGVEKDNSSGVAAWWRVAVTAC